MFTLHLISFRAERDGWNKLLSSANRDVVWWRCCTAAYSTVSLRLEVPDVVFAAIKHINCWTYLTNYKESPWLYLELTKKMFTIVGGETIKGMTSEESLAVVMLLLLNVLVSLLWCFSCSNSDCECSNCVGLQVIWMNHWAHNVLYKVALIRILVLKAGAVLIVGQTSVYFALKVKRFRQFFSLRSGRVTPEIFCIIC